VRTKSKFLPLGLAAAALLAGCGGGGNESAEIPAFDAALTQAAHVLDNQRYFGSAAAFTLDVDGGAKTLKRVGSSGSGVLELRVRQASTPEGSELSFTGAERSATVLDPIGAGPEFLQVDGHWYQGQPLAAELLAGGGASAIKLIGGLDGAGVQPATAATEAAPPPTGTGSANALPFVLGAAKSLGIVFTGSIADETLTYVADVNRAQLSRFLQDNLTGIGAAQATEISSLLADSFELTIGFDSQLRPITLYLTLTLDQAEVKTLEGLLPRLRALVGSDLRGLSFSYSEQASYGSGVALTPAPEAGEFGSVQAGLSALYKLPLIHEVLAAYHG
jgi:hypothetical protein